MKTIAYYPKKRILAVLDENGYADEVMYEGNTAEHKFFEALVAEDMNISIVDGSFKIKGKQANMQAFIDAHSQKSMQKITIKMSQQ